MRPPDRDASRFSPIRRGLLLAGAAALIGACAAPAPRPLDPVVLAVSLVAQPDINPDTRGRAAPVAVRVLELRSSSGFESADFFALYERDQATLAAEMLAREQFVLKPGETQSYTRKANADTRFLGVLVAYRDLERSVWRTTVPIAAPAESSRTRQQRVRVMLERAAVRVQVSPPL